MAAKEKEKFSLGAVVLEPGSSIKNKTGDWRSYRPKIIEEKCKRCGICWLNCPDMAIVVEKDGAYHVNYDYCKGCLICFRECPFKAIDSEVESK